MTETPMRRCTRCKVPKPYNDFYKAQKGLLKLSAYCKPCCLAYKHERYPKDQQRAWEKTKRDKLKATFLAAYGGKCACCGETTPEFLTVDHIGNDGEAHRKRLFPTRPRGGSTNYVIRDLQKQGWPDWVRILCFNCNFGRRGRSECPHRRGSGKGDANGTDHRPGRIGENIHVNAAN